MPGESEREKAKRRRDEKADERERQRAEKAEEDRKAALLREYPEVHDRVKLALDPESVMAGQSIKKILDFYIINNAAYYKIKNEAESAMQIRRARLWLLARLDKADRERDRRKAGELSAFDRGQSEELEKKIEEETREKLSSSARKLSILLSLFGVLLKKAAPSCLRRQQF